MTDKELLEYAAKAAGIRLEWIGNASFDCTSLKVGKPTYKGALWMPLNDDGDVLRLAVKLKMEFYFEEQFQKECVEVLHSFEDNKHKAKCVLQDLGTDPYAATRRAIVRAAAEIGKAMT